MNADRLERALSEAIEDLAGGRAPDYLDDILERTSRTRQRPWWTFPGRYLSMSSTLKFAVAASLAFAIGVGTASIIRPTGNDPSSTLPGAATTSVPTEEPVSAQESSATSIRSEPVEFQARWTYGIGISTSGSIAAPVAEYTSLGDGWSGTSNLGWRPRVSEPGDPRLEGEIQLIASSMNHGGLELWNGAFRIENEYGAWQQRPMIQSIKLSDEREPMTWTAVFDGEGDFEGMVVIAGITRARGGWDVEGVIVDAAVLPESPATLDLVD